MLVRDMGIESEEEQEEQEYEKEVKGGEQDEGGFMFTTTCLLRFRVSYLDARVKRKQNGLGYMI